MTITFPRAMPTEGADDQQFDLQRVDFMTADGDGRLASTSAGPPLWRLALTLGEMAQADADAAALGELDRVAGEVDQDLPHPVGIAQHGGREVLGHVEGDLDALVLGAGRQQLDDPLGERRQVEGLGREVEAPGLDPREVEDPVDQAEQRLAAGADRLNVGALLRIQLGPEHEVGHAQDAVERRPHLVAHRREEAGFRDARRLGALQGRVAAADRLDPRGHVPARAQPVRRVAVRHRHLHEGEPARPPVRRPDLRLQAADPVRPDLHGVPVEDLEIVPGADQRDRLAAEQAGEILVGVGDASAGIALDDDLGGGGHQGPVAVLALADPPDAVLQPLGLALGAPRAEQAPEAEGQSGRCQERQDRRHRVDHSGLPGVGPVRGRIAAEAEGGVGKGP